MARARITTERVTTVTIVTFTWCNCTFVKIQFASRSIKSLATVTRWLVCAVHARSVVVTEAVLTGAAAAAGTVRALAHPAAGSTAQLTRASIQTRA